MSTDLVQGKFGSVVNVTSVNAIPLGYGKDIVLEEAVGNQGNELEKIALDPSLNYMVLSKSDQHQDVSMSTRVRRLPVKFSKDFFMNKHSAGTLKYNSKISTCIQVFHQNVQSLNNKKLNIDVLLTDNTLEMDVLRITEHWMGEDEID
jgi:hypothetical protein